MNKKSLLNLKIFERFDTINLIILIPYTLFLLTFVITNEYIFPFVLISVIGVILKIYNGGGFLIKEVILLISITIGAYISYRTASLGVLSLPLGIISTLILVTSYAILSEESVQETQVLNPMKGKQFLGYSIKQYGIVLMTLVSMSIALSFEQGFLNSFRIVFGSVLVLFLPGFLLSFVWFEKSKLDIIERIALSFGLSISVVPLLVFFTNLLGMSISLPNTLLALGLVSFGTLAWLISKNRV